jgi:hypothetical protein
LVVGINRRNDQSNCDIQYSYRSDRKSSDFTKHLFNWINHCVVPCLAEQAERFLWQAGRAVRSAILDKEAKSSDNIANHKKLRTGNLRIQDCCEIWKYIKILRLPDLSTHRLDEILLGGIIGAIFYSH